MLKFVSFSKGELKVARGHLLLLLIFAINKSHNIQTEIK